MKTFDFAIAVALAIATLSLSVRAQGIPPLEDILREADEAVASQSGQVDKTVTKAIDTYRRHLRNPRQVSSDDVAFQQGQVVALGPAASPRLLEAFGKEDDEKLLRGIAETIVMIDDDKCTQPLLEHARGKHAPRAALATMALGALRRESAAPIIAELLAKEALPSAVRAEAILALARMGSEDGRQPMIDGLQNRSSSVRRAAAEAMGLRAEGRDYRKLEALLEDPAVDVVITTIQSLGLIATRDGHSGARTFVHTALEDSRFEIVEAAVEVLKSAGRPDTTRVPLKKLIDTFGREDASRKEQTIRREAAKVLFDLGDSYGLDKFAEPHRKRLRTNRRRFAKQNIDLSDLYWEFGDYKGVIKNHSNSIKAATTAEETSRLNDHLARSYARGKKFNKAKEILVRMIGKAPWPALANDPDYAAMRKHPRYKKDFGGERN